MFLENGYELQGTISNAIINLNDSWTKVLVIETNLTQGEATELFKDIREISSKDDSRETIYKVKNLIDVKVEENKTYIWLEFDYSYVRDTKDLELEKEVNEIANYNVDLDYRVSLIELNLI